MGFDRLAPHYRWMEFLAAGEQLQRCRIRFLPKLCSAKRILILGDGNGRFSTECRRAVPDAQITSIDASERMLSLAKRRVQRYGFNMERIQFVHADAFEWNTAERFDAIITHFFLDCFQRTELEPLIAKLAAIAEPQAQWLIADFREPSSGIARIRGRLILRSLYGFFRLTTGITADRIVPPDPFLLQHGFRLAERRESDWGLLYSDLWRRNG